MKNETFSTICPVVKSRILLSDATPHSEDAGRCIYRECSNVLNCFFRSDFQDEIPDCLLHQNFPVN